MRGILVNLYRSDDLGDCTAGGVTGPDHDATRGRVYLFGVPRGNVTLDELRPGDVALVLVKLSGRYVFAQPLDAAGTRYIDGGNFVYASDSRFAQACGHGYPIAVHDRVER